MNITKPTSHPLKKGGFCIDFLLYLWYIYIALGIVYYRFCPTYERTTQMTKYRRGTDLKNCPDECVYHNYKVCRMSGPDVGFVEEHNYWCDCQPADTCPREEAEKCGTESIAVTAGCSDVCPPPKREQKATVFKTCDTCRYLRTNHGKYRCFAHPPVSVDGTYSENTSWLRPEVSKLDFCSEWKERTNA